MDIAPSPAATHPPKAGWLEHNGGPVEVGHRGTGFGFDNEFPVHTVHLTPFGLADRPVTCGEWLSFMEDDGYSRPEFWLSDGWAVVNAQHWDAPLYWTRDPDQPDRWLQFTLSGLRPVDPDEPVCHVSYYEADAFAHWTGMRLPTESEWETIALTHGEGTNFLREDILSSRPTAPAARPDGQRDLRRHLGVDVERLLALPRLPSGARRRRRVQRQVHGEPVRPPRRLLRHPGRARASDLPQLLSPRCPLGLQRRPTGPGPLSDMTYTIDVHLSPDEVRRQMRADAIEGLQGRVKSIPPVWFYDERGSRLFEDITQLPEYYPTRAERALLEAHASDIAELSKADTLVELGAGACDKTRVLLTAMQEAGTLSRYVPFDVSDDFLRDVAATLAEEYDQLDIHVVIGDFHQHLGEIPADGTQDDRVPGRDHRQPGPRPTGPVPGRAERHHVRRRLTAHRHRSGQGPKAARRRL